MHYKEVKSILLPNNGMNIYRGCTHGCIYCDARSACYCMQHKFEDIEVKVNALDLLEESLAKKRKKCMISTGAMCDPYMHVEKSIEYTKKCLEIVKKHEFGINLQTKSNLILRDLEQIKSINNTTKCVVQMTMTTYDENLCKKIEPAVCTTKERFEALKILRDNGIPTVVWLCPILPYINDTEENIRGILQYCIEAEVKGIIFFGVGLTLRAGSREYFYKALDKHFLGLKERYQSEYGNNYQLESPNSQKLRKFFYAECKKHNINCNNNEIFNYLGTYENKQIVQQLSLF